MHFKPGWYRGLNGTKFLTTVCENQRKSANSQRNATLSHIKSCITQTQVSPQYELAIMLL